MLAAVAAWWVQGIAADWWAGVTGKRLPSQQYRAIRAKERAAAYKAAGRKPLPANGAREYAGAMWALAWSTAERKSSAWVERRQARDPHRPRPARDYARTVWDTGPRRKYRQTFEQLAERRRQKLIDKEDTAIDAAPRDPEAPSGPRPEPKQPEPESAEPEQPQPAAQANPEPEAASAPCPACSGSGKTLDQEAMAQWSEKFGAAVDKAMAGDRQGLTEAEALSDVKPRPAACESCQGSGDSSEPAQLAQVLPFPSANEQPDNQQGGGAPDTETALSPKQQQQLEQQTEGESMSDNGSDRSGELDSAEFLGLMPTLQWARENATVFRAFVPTIERASSSIQESGSEGTAVELCARMQEMHGELADSYEQLADELEKQMQVKEAYDQTPEAGDKSWLQGGE